MAIAKTLATAVAALMVSTGLCSAAVFDFNFTPTFGAIAASGTLTTDSLDLFANVIDVSGTVNDTPIQGVAPGVNILHTTGFATVFSFFDINGVSYDIASFAPPLAFASSGTTNATGTLTIAPEGVSAVPLPASASMFGAAVLTLGLVGFGAKRKMGAVAA